MFSSIQTDYRQLIISVQKKRNFSCNHIHTVGENIETTEGQSETSQLPLDPGEQAEAAGA